MIENVCVQIWYKHTGINFKSWFSFVSSKSSWRVISLSDGISRPYSAFFWETDVGLLAGSDYPGPIDPLS
jgi:hypothetical protein